MVEVAEEVEKDAAEGTVPETARGCLLRTRRASNGGVTRSTQSDGGASCPGYRFPVRFFADNLDPAPPHLRLSRPRSLYPPSFSLALLRPLVPSRLHSPSDPCKNSASLREEICKTRKPAARGTYDAAFLVSRFPLLARLVCAPSSLPPSNEMAGKITIPRQPRWDRNRNFIRANVSQTWPRPVYADTPSERISYRGDVERNSYRFSINFRPRLTTKSRSIYPIASWENVSIPRNSSGLRARRRSPDLSHRRVPANFSTVFRRLNDRTRRPWTSISSVVSIINACPPVILPRSRTRRCTYTELADRNVAASKRKGRVLGAIRNAYSPVASIRKV